MVKCYKLLVGSALLFSLLPAANAQFTQQGPQLVGTGNGAGGIQSSALSADGNTALVGDFSDNGGVGAMWVFTRSGGVWTQQDKLIGSGSVGTSLQGWSVALSADGNTALVGGPSDNQKTGAAWVFSRSGGVWTQQGGKLIGSGAIGPAVQGRSVALSADGNTALVGGDEDNAVVGAAWVFTRSGGVWTQQGGKLVGSDASGPAAQGMSVALSGDGNTALLGGWMDNGGAGATWAFTRSAGVWNQQGPKLAGSGAVGQSHQGWSVALSADGDTALVGAFQDGQGAGAAWVFTRSGGVWTEQGGRLVSAGSIGPANLGWSAALSADGNTALLGGPTDVGDLGAAWVFTRSGDLWSQQGNKLTGSANGILKQGWSVALSGDGCTALVGSSSDATFVFVTSKPSTTTLSTSADPALYGQAVTYTATVTAGATGTVTFTIDGVPQSTAPLSSGQAQFTVSNLAPGNHSISAAYNGDPTFAPSASNVVTQTVYPLGVISLWANTVVSLGQSVRLPVTLAKPAPPAGLTIYLTSSDPSTVTVTPSVFIPGGRSTPNVQPQLGGLDLGIATITATALGYTPASQSVRLTATIAFARCCVTITGAATQSVVLTLSGPAPAGGLTIRLIADDPMVAAVPATVTFPANATSVNVAITGVAAGITTIHAEALPNLSEARVKVTVR